MAMMLLWGWLAKMLKVAYADDGYVAKCRDAMAQQLSTSHVTDTECQDKVISIYCARLLKVERPTPFRSGCPLDPKILASPNYAIEGHVPEVDADKTEYRSPHHVPLGVLVLVFYRKQVSIVQRLVQDLWDKHHTFLLHVDPKAEHDVSQQLRSWVAADVSLRKNVHIHVQVDVKRSGMSLLQAELFGLHQLLQLSTAWRYFLILSDSDQLVRPASFLQNFLALRWGESFINTEVLNGRPRSLAIECRDRVHAVRMGGHESAIPSRPGLTLASGSQFVVLFRDFAELAASAFEERGNHVAVLKTWSHLNVSISAGDVLGEVGDFASPDETFFHTLAVNSEHCTSHARHNFHFHDTQGNFLDESSQSYTDFPTGSPPVLSQSHSVLLQEVRSHQPIVFARKFDPHNTSSMTFLQHIREVLSSTPKTSLRTLHVKDMTWGRRISSAVIGAECMSHVQLSDVQQVEHQPDSVFDIYPSTYIFQVHGLSARCVDAGIHTPIRGENTSARGELWLQERYAVPRYDTSTVSRARSAFRSPLLWLRIGLDWSARHLGFQGPVAVMSAEAVIKLGVFVVLHWIPAQAPRQLRFKWSGPGGATFFEEDEVPAWSLLSASHSTLQRRPLAGWWSLQVMQHVKGRSRAPTIGERQFFIFNATYPLDPDAVQLFFFPSKKQ